MLTKRELIDILEQFDDESLILISDGENWCHIGDIEKAGDCCCLNVLEDLHLMDD